MKIRRAICRGNKQLWQGRVSYPLLARQYWIPVPLKARWSVCSASRASYGYILWNPFFPGKRKRNSFSPAISLWTGHNEPIRSATGSWQESGQWRRRRSNLHSTGCLPGCAAFSGLYSPKDQKAAGGCCRRSARQAFQARDTGLMENMRCFLRAMRLKTAGCFCLENHPSSLHSRLQAGAFWKYPPTRHHRHRQSCL